MITAEEGLAVHRELGKRLLLAADDLWKQGKRLEAFSQVVFAFNEYARATNAPYDVHAMLVDMQADFSNRAEGRPILKPQRTKNSPRKPVQFEALLAYASVCIDYHGGTPTACKNVEDKLRKANCPLPNNRTHGAKTSGASMQNWRKQRRSKRQSESINLHFEAARDDVKKLASEKRISRAEAADVILDFAIEVFRVT